MVWKKGIMDRWIDGCIEGRKGEQNNKESGIDDCLEVRMYGLKEG